MNSIDFPGIELAQGVDFEELSEIIDAWEVSIGRSKKNMDESPLTLGQSFALSGSFALADVLSWQEASIAQQSSGVLTLSDLEAAFVSLWNAPCASPDYFFVVSPTMKRRLLHLQRIARLYEVVAPRTQRKLRKCIERRIQARLVQGRRRIARIERRELREERKVLEAR